MATRLLMCPGGYPVAETVRRVRVSQIIVNPNTLSTAVQCTLTGRTQKQGKYPTIFEMKDNDGKVTLPYDLDVQCDDGIRAATLTNCGAGSAASPMNGVMIYIE